MAVQLARLRFIKIKGRIVPIRAKTLAKRLPKAMNDLIDRAITKKQKPFAIEAERLGKGIDFETFGPVSTHRGDLVFKLNRGTKFRQKISKNLKKLYPGIEDPAVRSKTLGDSLPNYGVPTIPSETVVLPKGKKGLIQEYVNFDNGGMVSTKNLGKIPQKWKDQSYLKRETDRLTKETGLNFDPNFGNVAPGGYLTDTALGRLPRLRDVQTSSTTRELFENMAENKKFSDYVSDAAIADSVSKKTVKKINSLRKKGFRLKPSKDFGHGLEYELLSPSQRINRARKSGIQFDKNGRPIKPKRK